jgi:class 3 adenylate cyclase
VTRKLAALIAADAVGYSRLMGADEEGTLRQLKSHRKELVNPKITEHHGRIVKTTGDGCTGEDGRARQWRMIAPSDVSSSEVRQK